jgi:hypothetical protein
MAAHYDIYREQLASLHHGHALWEPNPPGDIYSRISIGDVGYIREGYFYRLFNILLPEDHPSHELHGVPSEFETLELNQFPNIVRTLPKGDYYSSGVRSTNMSIGAQIAA